MIAASRKRSLNCCALSALCLGLMAPAEAPGQSDRNVTTTRDREVLPSLLPPQVLEGARVSDQPRYYLDTIDTLNRYATDQYRPAPGLAKNNYIVKVYPIYNTEAIEIQSYLLRSLAFEGGVAEVMGAPGVMDQNGRGVQFLFVTAPDFMIPGIDEIIAMTDRDGFKFFDATGMDHGFGPGAVRYVGRHRTASELAAILAGTELGNIGAFLFPPFADDSTNSIYVVENPTDVGDSLLALEAFDQPPLQMELEVTIYEVDDGDRGKLGLDWDAWKRFTAGSFAYESTGGSTFIDRDSDTFATLLTLDARVLADFLNYTVQTGTSRVVTSTKLTMVNSEDNPGALSGGVRGLLTGTPAIIESATYYPYTVVQEDVGGTNSSNGRNEIIDDAYEGVRVEILPFIALESITLSVTATVNSLVGFSKDTDVPIISSRNVNSVVNLKDGEPVVLGGLDRTTNTESRVGIPLLKEVPVLQYLFSKESTDKSTSKVLIALRPRIKSSDTEAAATFIPTP